MGCPDANSIAEYAVGSLAQSERTTVEAHLGSCAECRRVIAGLRYTSLGVRRPGEAIAGGTAVGRFIVLERIGAGAMGSVYAAHDPELDRKVALKILHGAPDKERLVAEARAMARLAHPNVVPILDLGSDGERLFLAMELVEGMTLRQWLAERPRPRREIVAVLLEAGRGLAASHAASLTHRDFKPENVLVGKDGRVRVTDFGLARPGPVSGAAGDDLQRSAEIAGTPAYMAPEQFRGAGAGPAADQFSFCVVSWEALYRQPPFDAGDPPTLQRLAEAVLAGRIREPPSQKDVPAWLRRVLDRGLSLEPEDRFGSMEALLTALATDPGEARRKKLVSAAALVAVAGLSAGGYQLVEGRRQLCRGAELKLAGIWDAPRKAAGEKAFLASGLPYAAAAWAAVIRRLDAYSHDWVSMHTEACRATRLRGEQSEELLDLRMGCLSERLQELKASEELFAGADRGVVGNAAQVAWGLSPISGCADVGALWARLPPMRDAATRSQVEAARAQIAGAKVLDDGGRAHPGLAAARAALSAARTTGYPPVEAEALVQLGKGQMSVRQDEAATKTLEDAFYAAEASKHDSVAVRAATLLVTHLVLDLPRPADAQRWGRMAQAVLQRSGTPPESQAALEGSLADLLNDQGKYEEALAAHRRALALREKAFGADFPALAGSHDGMAVALENLGRYDEALAEYRRALSIRENTLGAGHPYVADVHLGMGRVLTEQARYDEALAELRRSLAINEKIDPEHPDVARSLNDIGAVLRMQGKFSESLAHHRRALAILEKALGPDHQQVASCRIDLGLALGDAGRYDEALAELRRSLATTEKTRGPEHQEAAMARNNLGLMLGKQGKHAQALDEYRRALAIFDKTLGPDQQDSVMARINVGSAYLDLRQYGEAIGHLTAALATLDGKEPPPELHGEACYTLARALLGAKREPARVAELMRRARDDFAKVPSRKKDLDKIDAWLSRR